MTTNDLIAFIYESGVCLAILYAMYWFFLKRETYFRFNRFYLLGALVLSCVLPLGNLGYFTNSRGISSLEGITSIAQTIRIPEVNMAEGSGQVSGFSFNWRHLLLLAYLLGVSIILSRTIMGIIKVSLLKKRSRKVYLEGYSLVYMARETAPFSFFRTIFLNETLNDEGDQAHIINHEKVHIRQMHSYDNLIVEFFFALFWFNPFMWFLKKALRNTHEYLADHGVLDVTSASADYQLLLLKQVTGFMPLVATNSFNSSIKKRIKMMCRNKSTFLAKFKPLLLVPIIAFLTLVFACSEKPADLMVEPEQEAITEEVPEATLPLAEENTSQGESVPEEDQVFYIVEEMPTFNNGDPAEEFRAFIAQNLQYPPEAAEKGIEGRVIVQFAVDETGHVENVVVVRSVEPALDQEAIRVVESSPVWEPGKQRGQAVKVLFTFPINFVKE